MISGFSPGVDEGVHPAPKKKAAGAQNLMEARQVSKARKYASHTAWFTQARFGMFVHYGLYSLHGRGEWHMFNERIPREEYNKLQGQFYADKFDAAELVGLAKRSGAGYVVMGARHHDGFCLWDCKTTNFSSIHAPAGRDLIREYVDACRQAGLRVGIYYSIMSWQFPASYHGPNKDREGWEAMVRETHDQIHELMTNYGKIDLLWYDGCVVPGSGEDSIRAKYWRTDELNQMVRQLQPEILINDRSASEEDITTPEQHLTPPPEGRLWECCQTLGKYWGWHEDEVELKEPEELIRQLIYCSRFGGNYLLNVGPMGNGMVPKEQAERLEAVGAWLAVNGESVRGSERTPYTEADHILGAATVRANYLYFHNSNWPELPTRIAGINVPILSVRLLKTGEELDFQHAVDGTVTLCCLPSEAFNSGMNVLALELARPVPRVRPPSLLIERDTGRFDPAEAEVNQISGWDWGTTQHLRFSAPVAGKYILELGVIGKGAMSFEILLDGVRQPEPHCLTCADYPDTLRLENLSLSAGEHELSFRSEGDMPFGLYLWRLQPAWRILGGKHWRAIGPFPTSYTAQGTSEEVKEALSVAFPPEQKNFKSDTTYVGTAGRNVEWQTILEDRQTIHFPTVCGEDHSGVCYARTVIESPRDCAVDMLMGCDWWANVMVNRVLIQSNRDASAVEEDGAWFIGWKPLPAKLQLIKGLNEILVKCHPGSTNNWFTFYLNDFGDLKITA